MYTDNFQNNNSYNDRPVWTPPQRESNQSLYTAAFVLGILTIVTTLMMTVYVPLILGGIAIIIAIISRADNEKLNRQASLGMKLAICGLILDIVLIGGSFYAVFTNPDARQEVNSTFEQMYGQSFDELLEEIVQGGQSV